MAKIVWRYGVQCTGVKNRCRKSDFHSSNKNELGESIEEPTESEAKKRAIKWIAENMKSFSNATATVTAWEQDGEMETWNIFSNAHNKKFPLDFTV